MFKWGFVRVTVLYQKDLIHQRCCTSLIYVATQPDSHYLHGLRMSNSEPPLRIPVVVVEAESNVGRLISNKKLGTGSFVACMHM